MAFGETEEITTAIFKKLDKWINDPPDYDDVEKAYKMRGRLQSTKIALVRDIEAAEDEIVSDEDNKPRSNATRIKKLEATKNLRNKLAEVECQMAENDALCKWLEFRKSMFSAAVFRVKIQYEI